jgi:hypothetical protein
VVYPPTAGIAPFLGERLSMGLGGPGEADRRAHRRLQTHLEAGFEVPGETQIFECKVIDLSESGARLRSEVALRPGQHGILVVAPPDAGIPLVAVVEVVRTDLRLDDPEQDACVQFEKLSPATQSRLARMIVGLANGSAV